MGYSALININPTASAVFANAQFFGLGMNVPGTDATEAKAQIKVRFAGTFSRLATVVKVTDYTLTFRINGVNSALTVTGSGPTTDTTHSVAAAAGDLYSVGVSGVSGSPTLYSFSALFKATSTHTALYFAQFTNSTVTNTGLTEFLPYCRSANNTTTEDNVAVTARAAGTLSNASIYVSANASTGTSVYTNRLGKADGTVTISIGAGLTGLFEDTTHSDTLTAGQTFCGKVITGATGGLTINVFGIHFQNSTAPANDMLGYSNTAQAAGAGNTFFAIAGRATAGATETPAAFAVGYAVNVSNFRIRLSANTYAANATATIRKNGADGAQTMTLTAGVSGLFEDTTHSDVFAATDTINWRITGGTSGTAIIQTVASTWRDITPTAQACAAASSPASSLVRSAGKLARGSSSATASLVRAIAIVRAASTAPLSSLIKAVAAIRRASASSTASLATAKTTATAAQASTSPAAKLTKSAGKAPSASASATAALTRAMAVIRRATSSPLASLTRADSRTGQASTAPVASDTRAVAIARGASSSPLASLLKSTAKALKAASSPLAALTTIKAAAKAISASASAAASLVRQAAASRQATTSPLVSLTRQAARSAPASSAPAAALLRATSVKRQASASAAATMTRSPGKSLLASASAVAALVRAVAAVRLAASSPAASLLRADARAVQASTSPTSTATRSAAIIRQGAAAPIAGLIKGPIKPLAASASPIASLAAIKVALKTLAASASAVASLTRQASAMRQALTSPAASMVRGPAKPTAATSSPQASLARGITAGRQATATGAASLTHLPAAIRTALAAAVASISKAPSRAIATTTAPLAALIRATARKGSASAAAAATLDTADTAPLQAMSAPVAALGATRHVPAIANVLALVAASILKAVSVRPTASASAAATMDTHKTVPPLGTSALAVASLTAQYFHMFRRRLAAMFRRLR